MFVTNSVFKGGDGTGTARAIAMSPGYSVGTPVQKFHSLLARGAFP